MRAYVIALLILCAGGFGCQSSNPPDTNKGGETQRAAVDAPEAAPMGAQAGPGKLGKIPEEGTKSALTNEDWRKLLSSEEYNVLREEGTERAFTGEFWDNKAEGTYYCGGCGAPVFSSSDKFKSGTGWPSYTRPISDKRIETKTDNKFGMARTEVHCAHCGGHMGHIFEDGPEPTGLRYCINSISMDFVPKQATAEKTATP